MFVMQWPPKSKSSILLFYRSLRIPTSTLINALATLVSSIVLSCLRYHASWTSSVWPMWFVIHVNSPAVRSMICIIVETLLRVLVGVINFGLVRSSFFVIPCKVSHLTNLCEPCPRANMRSFSSFTPISLRQDINLLLPCTTSSVDSIGIITFFREPFFFFFPDT